MRGLFLRTKSKSTQKALIKFFSYLIIFMGLILIFFPIIWMFGISLKDQQELFKLSILPKTYHWENYINLFTVIPYGRYFLNTTYITVISVIGGALVSSLVAFGFARLRFPGRSVLFIVMLSTMMIPFPVIMIPTFSLFKSLGWIDTFKPLIIPTVITGAPGGAFYIFLLRQFFMSIPRELDEAARIDGCSYLGLYWKIMLPLAKPGLLAVGLYLFMAKWNNLMGPLIYLNSEHKRTLSLGLALLTKQPEEPVLYLNLLMGGAFLSMIPVLVIFFFLQRYFIQGTVVSGVKG